MSEAALPDITHEWLLARKAVVWETMQDLLARSLKVHTLTQEFEDWIPDFAYGEAEITVKSGRWTREFFGNPAVIVPVRSWDRELVDLVAFRISTPKSFWPMVGSVPLLGIEALYRAEWDEKPLMVYECPLDWLKADRDGVVILDWKHYWPAWFGGVKAVRVPDRKFGERLQKGLEHPLSIPIIESPV